MNNDPGAGVAYRNALRAMSAEQKLLVAESLRAFAWELKKAAIARRNPELSSTEVNERVREMFRHDGA
ncbi:MAG: hypothetical protein ACREL6_02485 [Gemmatimonadales bacterium]